MNKTEDRLRRIEIHLDLAETLFLLKEDEFKAIKNQPGWVGKKMNKKLAEG